MGEECHFRGEGWWVGLRTTPRCPTCSGPATHVWPGYYGSADWPLRGAGPDLFLCAAHAAWLMRQRIIATHRIRCIGQPVWELPAPEEF